MNVLPWKSKWTVLLTSSFLLMALVLGRATLYRAGDEDRVQYDLEVDQHFAYQLDYELMGQTQLGAIRGQASGESLQSEVKVAARLDLKLKSQTNQDMTFAMQLRPSLWQEQLAGSPALEAPQLIEGEVLFSRQGEFLRFALSEPSFDRFAPWVVELLLPFSHVLPRRGETEWLAAEQSLQYKTPVLWQRLRGQDQALTLAKVYQSSDRLPSVQGSGELVLNLQKFVERASGTRHRRFYKGSTLLSSDGVKWQLKRLPDAVLPDFRLTTQMVADSLAGQTYTMRIQKLTLERTLGMSSVADIQRLLEASKDQALVDTVPAYQKLKALFTLHPECMAEFARFVLDYPYEDPRSSHVLAALTAVGTAEAQAFLRYLGEELQADTTKLRLLLPHLSMTELPDPATEDYLRRLTEDERIAISTTAQLALGTVAYQIRSQDPKRAERLLSEQIGRLQTSSDRGTQLNALRAIGNMGNPSQLAVITPLLGAKDLELRREAYSALRHVEDPGARSTMLSALETEQDTTLRLVVAEGLRYTALQVYEVERLAHLLSKERDVQVIKFVADHLAQHAVEIPEASRLLRSFQAECAHPDLCSYLSGLVTSLEPER